MKGGESTTFMKQKHYLCVYTISHFASVPRSPRGGAAGGGVNVLLILRQKKKHRLA